MTSSASVRMASPVSWAGEVAWRGLRMGLRPLQAVMMAPAAAVSWGAGGHAVASS